MDWHVNGRMVPADDAQVAARDAGLQHGVGLFETMSAYQGRVFRLEPHLARLATSAVELGLAPRIDTAPLGEAVRETIEHNGLSDARVRLTLTPGPVAMRKPDPGEPPPAPTLIVQPEPATQYDPAYFEQGITVTIAGPLANPFDPAAGHKTLNYWTRLRTLRRAAEAGAGEAVWLNVSNHLASGAVSNLFLVKGDELLTPFARGEEIEGALPAPVLPGVTRAEVEELAPSLGLTFVRRMLTVEELLGADEVFLTNSSWLVLPVSRVEKHEVGSGAAGEKTLAIRAALLEEVKKE